MIHYFEGIDHLILVEHSLPASGIYDYDEARAEWQMTAKGPQKVRPNLNILDTDLFIINRQATTPQQFRQEFVGLLVHVAQQSDVPKALPLDALKTLRMCLPGPTRRFYSVLLSIKTWTLLCPQCAGDTQDSYAAKHIVFDDSVPDGMILGMARPEKVGRIAYGGSYSNDSFIAGAVVGERAVKAVQVPS